MSENSAVFNSCVSAKRHEFLEGFLFDLPSLGGGRLALFVMLLIGFLRIVHFDEIVGLIVCEGALFGKTAKQCSRTRIAGKISM